MYASHDFSRRDQRIYHLYHALRPYLPLPLLRILSRATLLLELTQALDGALLAILVNELGMTDHITPQMYAEPYRRCDTYEQRVRQINLLMEL